MKDKVNNVFEGIVTSCNFLLFYTKWLEHLIEEEGVMVDGSTMAVIDDYKKVVYDVICPLAIKVIEQKTKRSAHDK